MADIPEQFKKRAVYTLPGMELVRALRDQVYTTVEPLAPAFLSRHLPAGR